MKPDILSPQGLAELARRAHGDTLLAFDYDGTLAPIVDAPDKATMPASTRELLRELAAVYPCIVLSGRAQGDALRRLRGAGVHEIVGNHGIEPRHSSGKFADLAQKWYAQLGADLADCAGVWIENKVYSLAVHYRQASYAEAVQARIEVAARRLEGARLVGGKAVVNVIPEGAPHKGLALVQAMRRRSCDQAIYVGDDATDEDVFDLEPSHEVLGIHVGSDEVASSAPFMLANQERVDDLLRALLGFRCA